MKLRNRLNQQCFIEEIGKYEMNDKVIDLSEIKFADIFGIISLIMILKREYEKNNTINLYLPHNLNVANYLHICGFVNCAKKYANIKYNAFNLISKIYSPLEILDTKDYIPIQIIRNKNEATKIVMNVIKWLQNKKIDDFNICTLLLELMDNSLNHANSNDGTIFIMQKYQDTLMISIADFGVGIKECIETNTYYKDMFENNESLIKYIFESNNYISSENSKERGNGFYGLSKYINESRNCFSICSRDGFYYHGYNETGKSHKYSTTMSDLNGTHINISIKLK